MGRATSNGNEGKSKMKQPSNIVVVVELIIIITVVVVMYVVERFI